VVYNYKKSEEAFILRKRNIYSVLAMILILFILGQPVSALVEQYASAVDIMKNDIETSINEMRLQKMNDNMLASFQNMILKHSKEIATMKKGLQSESQIAKDEEARIVKKYGDTPKSKWDTTDQNRYKECETAVINCNKTIDTLGVINKKFVDLNKSLQGKDSKTFQALLKPYLNQLSTLSNEIKAVDTFSQVSIFSTSSKKPLTFKNQSKNLEFYIDGQKIEPGKSKAIQIKNRIVSIRALAVTDRRAFIRTKAATQNTTITHRDDWQFSYTVTVPGGTGSDSATWKVAKEVYNWKAPKISLNTSKPFDSGKSTISSSKATNDVLTWNIPIISAQQFGSGSAATQSFFIAVSGEITWNNDRGGAVSQTTHKTENESFYGDMVVMVPSE